MTQAQAANEEEDPLYQTIGSAYRTQPFSDDVTQRHDVTNNAQTETRAVANENAEEAPHQGEVVVLPEKRKNSSRTCVVM